MRVTVHVLFACQPSSDMYANARNYVPVLAYQLQSAVPPAAQHGLWCNTIMNNDRDQSHALHYDACMVEITACRILCCLQETETVMLSSDKPPQTMYYDVCHVSDCQ
jgi:hypothetical protein